MLREFGEPIFQMHNSLKPMELAWEIKLNGTIEEILRLPLGVAGVVRTALDRIADIREAYDDCNMPDAVELGHRVYMQDLLDGLHAELIASSEYKIKCKYDSILRSAILVAGNWGVDWHDVFYATSYDAKIKPYSKRQTAMYQIALLQCVPEGKDGVESPLTERSDEEGPEDELATMEEYTTSTDEASHVLLSLPVQSSHQDLPVGIDSNLAKSLAR
ncbi:hypothetical protein FRC00_012865, partial [Tulasnella sp. 408]